LERTGRAAMMRSRPGRRRRKPGPRTEHRERAATPWCPPRTSRSGWSSRSTARRT
jgi:hypothetical protein